MDRIFKEIKKAIEEEMRNAEGAPPPGRQRDGGRRAQEHAEWLKQEQERLRGGRRSDNLQEIPVAARTEQEWETQTEQEWEQRPVRRPARERQPERRPERQEQPQQREASTQYQRSEARHQRQTAGAYRQRGGGTQLHRQVHAFLKSPRGLRQAFILREIVSKPVSLRDRDDHLIS